MVDCAVIRSAAEEHRSIGKNPVGIRILAAVKYTERRTGLQCHNPGYLPSTDPPILLVEGDLVVEVGDEFVANVKVCSAAVVSNVEIVGRVQAKPGVKSVTNRVDGFRERVVGIQLQAPANSMAQNYLSTVIAGGKGVSAEVVAGDIRIRPAGTSISPATGRRAAVERVDVNHPGQTSTESSYVINLNDRVLCKLPLRAKKTLIKEWCHQVLIHVTRRRNR